LGGVAKCAAADLDFWRVRPKLHALSFAIATMPIELTVRRRV